MVFHHHLPLFGNGLRLVHRVWEEEVRLMQAGGGLFLVYMEGHEAYVAPMAG